MHSDFSDSVSVSESFTFNWTALALRGIERRRTMRLGCIKDAAYVACPAWCDITLKTRLLLLLLLLLLRLRALLLTNLRGCDLIRLDILLGARRFIGYSSFSIPICFQFTKSFTTKALFLISLQVAFMLSPVPRYSDGAGMLSVRPSGVTLRYGGHKLSYTESDYTNNTRHTYRHSFNLTVSDQCKRNTLKFTVK